MLPTLLLLAFSNPSLPQPKTYQVEGVFCTPGFNVNSTSGYNLAIPKYNGPGTVVKVKLRVRGYSTGVFAYENINPSTGGSFTWGSQAYSNPSQVHISAYVPNVGYIYDKNNLHNPHTGSVAAYDGQQDYSGPSGGTFAWIKAWQPDNTILTGSQAALFQGSGNAWVSYSAQSTNYVDTTNGIILMDQENEYATSCVEVEWTIH